MEKADIQNVRKYFGSANSYNGFISFFDRIFKSNDFSKIYVLKGGPGTGKSSFMKKIVNNIGLSKENIEEIYCSSDPDSLDGIIISNENGRVAIIDGTAPHERDAIIPGAIDEIINLGDAWDERFLIAQRSDILNLQSEKSEAYKTAYNYLRIAGCANDFVKKTYQSVFNKIEAKNKAELILKDYIGCETGEKEFKFISSFGRRGLLTLRPDSHIKTISICGNVYARSLFLNACISVLRNDRLTVFPSPLDLEIIEAIQVNNTGVFIMGTESGDMNADELIQISAVDSERVRCANTIKDDALNEAERWFLIASDFHFRLESIYKRSMDFTTIDRISDKKIDEIKNILQIS